VTAPRIVEAASKSGTGDSGLGATLAVRVSPGAKQARILGVHGDALKVAVRQPPDRGRANKEVCRMLAEALAVAPRDVCVARGPTSKDKVLQFDGIDAATLRARVSALLVGLGAS